MIRKAAAAPVGVNRRRRAELQRLTQTGEGLLQPAAGLAIGLEASPTDGTADQRIGEFASVQHRPPAAGATHAVDHAGGSQLAPVGLQLPLMHPQRQGGPTPAIEAQHRPGPAGQLLQHPGVERHLGGPIGGEGRNPAPIHGHGCGRSGKTGTRPPGRWSLTVPHGLPAAPRDGLGPVAPAAPRHPGRSALRPAGHRRRAGVLAASAGPGALAPPGPGHQHPGDRSHHPGGQLGASTQRAGAERGDRRHRDRCGGRWAAVQPRRRCFGGMASAGPAGRDVWSAGLGGEPPPCAGGRRRNAAASPHRAERRGAGGGCRRWPAGPGRRPRDGAVDGALAESAALPGDPPEPPAPASPSSATVGPCR